MLSINKKIYKVILGSLFGIMLWIIMNGYLNYNVVIYSFNPIYLVMGTVIYMTLIVWFYKYVMNKINSIKGVEYLLFLIFVILSVLIGKYFMLNPSWDMKQVLNSSLCYIRNETYSYDYLARFPNNTMLVAIDALILRFTGSLGQKYPVTVLTMFNSIVVSLSVIISFYIVKEMFDRKKALFFMIICILTTPLLFYTAIYYSDTLSMLITILLLGNWLLIEKSERKVTHTILSVLCGILLFVAIKLKITSAFILIAIIVHKILQKEYKTILKKMLIIIPVTILLMVIFDNTILNVLAPKDKRAELQMPIQHFIMMGMNGVGGWSENEVKYSESFDSYESRKKGTTEKIIARLKEREMSVHIKNITNKLGFTWHDGTYFVIDYLKREPISKGVGHEIILANGKYSKYYKYFPQIMHFSMLIFIMINIRKKIKYNSFEEKDNIFLLEILGFTIFFIIWEARSRYLVTMLPIMIMAQIEGVEYVIKKTSRKKSQNTQSLNKKSKDVCNVEKDKLYIVMPAYNEEENIETVVKEWYDVVEKIGNDSRLLVVDDGSKDSTYEKLCKLKEKYEFLETLTKKNSGHGATVLVAYKYAIEHGADYIFQTDSDGQTLPEEFDSFWADRKKYDAIIGHRNHRQDGLSRIIVTKTLKIVLWCIFRLNIVDANTPYRLISREMLEKYIKEIPNDFNLSNVMLTVLLIENKQNVNFRPITFRQRQGGMNSINIKKITKIGITAIKDFKMLKKEMRKEKNLTMEET